MRSKWLGRSIIGLGVAIAVIAAVVWPRPPSVRAVGQSVSVSLVSPSYQQSLESYTGYTLTQKSRNNYDLTFPGSTSKVSIGSGTPTFRNRLTFTRWNEVSFALDLPTLTTGNLGNVATSGGALTWSNSNYSFEYRPTPPREGFNELGGLDLIITLNKRPPTNSFSFAFTSDTVGAYHQPPLTDMYKAGWSDDYECDISVNATHVWNTQTGQILTERPEHIVNSVALYATGKQGHTLGQTNYGTGKVGHWYSMQAVDAGGKTSPFGWAVSGNTITGSVSQAFLDAASYPVVIKPFGDTFGVTGVGGTTDFFASGRIYASGDASTGAAGTGVSMTMYGRGYPPQLTQMGLYNDTTLVGYTENVSLNATVTWYTGNFTSSPTLSAIPYYMAFNSNTANQKPYWDTTGTNNCTREIATFGTWPDPITWVNHTTNRTYSIYCTYTPSGGEPSITNTPGIKAFGTVANSAQLWAKGAEPSWPLGAENCTFTINNTGAATVNLTIKATDFTGGVGWILASSPGSNNVTLKAGAAGTANESVMVVLTTSDQTLYDGLAESTTIKWELHMETPTAVTDGIEKSSIITITATAA